MCKSFMLPIWTSYIYIIVMYKFFFNIYTYTTSCKCFGACKRIYHILFMIIPSWKSILINCGCIPPLNYILLQWATLIGPSQKNYDILIFLKISIFYQYGTMMVLFQKISWMHILPHFIAWVKLSFLTLFIVSCGVSF